MPIAEGDFWLHETKIVGDHLKEDIAKNIEPRFLRAYERLATRYKHSIAPVQKETCLGCFAKLPTSYTARGREDQAIITCENCGRILYWID